MIRPFKFWVVYERSDEPGGSWIGHALDFDVISYGDGLQDTIKMTVEAVALTLQDDLENGFDPIDRRAPTEYWDRMWRITSIGQRMSGSDALKDEDRIKAYVVQHAIAFKITSVLVDIDAAPEATGPEPTWIETCAA